jgi:hypothetical protein
MIEDLDCLDQLVRRNFFESAKFFLDLKFEEKQNQEEDEQ